jgi:hypothetical protein
MRMPAPPFIPALALSLPLLARTLGAQTAPDSLTSVCGQAAGGGSATSAAPTLLVTLFDRWHEAWLGSPAVADLTGNGPREILGRATRRCSAGTPPARRSSKSPPGPAGSGARR